MSKISVPPLGERLYKVSLFIPPSKVFLDVGTDHAYLPVYLIKMGILEKAIASDLKKGPLLSAKKTGEIYNVSDRLDLRLGSGFETVSEGEASSAACCGMGGILISELIKSSLNTVRKLDTLVLQPMTAAKELREFLNNNNFIIEKEVLAREDKKLYNIMKVTSGTSEKMTEAELYMGRLSKDDEHFEEYKKRQINKLKKQIEGLKKSSNNEDTLILKKTALLWEVEKW